MTPTTILPNETKLPEPRELFDTFFDTDLARWTFPEISGFRRTMNTLLGNVMLPETLIAMPATDVYEKDGKYIVEAALPGFKKDDISIEVTENRLIISAASREEKAEDKGQRYHYREVRRGAFSRSVAFPSDIDPEKIEATYENGILKVVVLPVKPVLPKKVAIKG